MQIVLESSRFITLRELRLRGTYEGLLNGLPTREKNLRLLERIAKNEGCARYGVAPIIISPVEVEIELPEGEEYPFGFPARLPDIYCIARFESIAPTQDGAGDASGLVIVWFQENFSVPPSPDILHQLKSVEWEKYAGNFQY